jgi:hypothetical protein
MSYNQLRLMRRVTTVIAFLAALIALARAIAQWLM